MIYYLTALTIGLMGSLHCIGMCGPLAIALPLKSKNKNTKWMSTIYYLVGKTIAYGILGLLSGIFATLTVLIGLQQYLSILAGVMIIIVLLVEYTKWFKKKFLEFSFKAYNLIKNKFLESIKRKNSASSFMLGLLNGMLPCGLVYFALTASIGAGGLLQSVFYMLIFGVGTSPLLYILIRIQLNQKMNSIKVISKVLPIFSLALAIFLIVRGINFGTSCENTKGIEKTYKPYVKCYNNLDNNKN